ncbi:MAG: hypothetical protein FWC89_06560 [Defluviitaleaceae bacterium]|nr:hypothetical protein [Defluviitaleaceae bacterium]
MTKQELNKMVDFINSLVGEWLPEESEAFSRIAYTPIYKAIKANDMTVIQLLESADKNVREQLLPAIGRALKENNAVKDGVIRPEYERAVLLYRSICEGDGIKPRL